MAKVIAMGIQNAGLEVSINYNPVNLRITTVDWALPQSGNVARVRIWDAGALIYDRTIAGPEAGTENVPGNFRLVEKTEGGETFLDLPPNITYHVNIETLG